MVEKLRFQGVSSAASLLLASEGESGRFEFKTSSDAVKPDVLVAAANWVALEPGRSEVTLLVGVREVTDEDTGLTIGEVVGLRGALAGHIELINNQAKNTLPVPIEVTIIEEGVASSTPFLRLTIRPTAPPHFDARGRRVTRHGASTRALQDQELLDLYLDREADRFRARFETIAETLDARLESVAEIATEAAEAAGQIPSLISDAESSASEAGWEAAMTRRGVDELGESIEALERRVDEVHDTSSVEIYRQLRYERERVWAAFCIDRVQRPSQTADRVGTKLANTLRVPIRLDDPVANYAELMAWREALEVENSPASAAWWSRTLKTVTLKAVEATAPLELPDWTAQIVELLEDGHRPMDIQLEPWPPAQT